MTKTKWRFIYNTQKVAAHITYPQMAAFVHNQRKTKNEELHRYLYKISDKTAF